MDYCRPSREEADGCNAQLHRRRHYLRGVSLLSQHLINTHPTPHSKNNCSERAERSGGHLTGLVWLAERWNSSRNGVPRARATSGMSQHRRARTRAARARARRVGALRQGRAPRRVAHRACRCSHGGRRGRCVGGGGRLGCDRRKCGGRRRRLWGCGGAAAAEAVRVKAQHHRHLLALFRGQGLEDLQALFVDARRRQLLVGRLSRAGAAAGCGRRFACTRQEGRK